MSSERQINYDLVLADLVARRDRLNHAIAAIEAIRGYVSAAVDASSADAVASFQVTASPTLRMDEFFGSTILDAAKKYLRMQKRLQSAPEIADALKRGGYLFNTETPVNTVTSILSRDDAKMGEVVRVGRGQFGLAEWYPTRPKRKRKNGEKDDEPEGEPMIVNPSPLPSSSSPT